MATEPINVNYDPTSEEDSQVAIKAMDNQRKGTDPISTIDASDIVQKARDWNDIQREQWAGDLITRRIKTIYTDAAYEADDMDVFYTDSAEFGGILQVISMEMPDIIENRSWSTIVSGSSSTQIGCNTVYLPIVDQQLYAGSTSWGVSVAYTGTQLNAAFNSAAELSQFDSYVRLVADNAIKYHLRSLNMTNRNNYIIEKFNWGNVSYTPYEDETHPGTQAKINVVNLVEEYCKATGKTSMTATAFRQDADAMRYAPLVFTKYRDLLYEMTTLFTTDPNSKGKFVPRNRLVFQLLGLFDDEMTTVMRSTTFHESLIKMPLFRRVTAWQGLVNYASETTTVASFDELSRIDVATSNGFENHNIQGVVGLMVDKWAIMHTIVQRRTAYQRDDIKDISMYDNQFTDKYINNLKLPGIVFVVQDYSANAE